MTRKCSIHDIQVDYYSIQSVYRRFVTSSTNIRSQVEDLWEPNQLVELSRFSWLLSKKGVSFLHKSRPKEKHQLKLLSALLINFHQYLKPFQCNSKHIWSLQYCQSLSGPLIRFTPEWILTLTKWVQSPKPAMQMQKSKSTNEIGWSAYIIVQHKWMRPNLSRIVTKKQ